MSLASLVEVPASSRAGNVPIRAANITAATSITHEVSNVALVAGGYAVAFVKSGHRIVETSTLTIAVAKVLRTDSALVGVL